MSPQMVCYTRYGYRSQKFLAATYVRNYIILASSGPYGPLLARSGYPRRDASFYNNPMIMICATVNTFTLLKTILCKFGPICLTRNALM